MTAPNHTTGERTAPNWDQQMRLEPATHSTVQVSTCTLKPNVTDKQTNSESGFYLTLKQKEAN